jgi:hypothetical protein
MAQKDINKCTPQEALLYIQFYFATVDSLNRALSKFETLERNAVTIAAASKFRALALEADRDLELLKNQRIAFLAGKASISPPTQEQVDDAIALSERIAKLAATAKQADAIIEIAAGVLNAFNELSAPPPVPA